MKGGYRRPATEEKEGREKEGETPSICALYDSLCLAACSQLTGRRSRAFVTGSELMVLHAEQGWQMDTTWNCGEAFSSLYITWGADYTCVLHLPFECAFYSIIHIKLFFGCTVFYVFFKSAGQTWKCRIENAHPNRFCVDACWMRTMSTLEPPLPAQWLTVLFRFLLSQMRIIMPRNRRRLQKTTMQENKNRKTFPPSSRIKT